MTVLVIDDDKCVGALVRRALRVGTVRQVENLDDAIRVATEWQPSVLVLDVFLGDDYGIDAIPMLRLACPRAQVVVLSAHFDKRDGRAALAAGAFSYLEKGDDLLLRRAIIGARARVQSTFVPADPSLIH